MRIGVFAVLALVGLASAAPVKIGKRGAKRCTCKPNGGAAVAWTDSSSSSNEGTDSSWLISGSSSSPGQDTSSGDQYGVLQRVVYVNVITVPVPVVTTCTATGTIVIENNITINITAVPTVITYTSTTTTTTTETSTVTQTGSVNPTNRSMTVSPSSKAISSVPQSASTTPEPGPGPTPYPKSDWPDHKVIGYYGVDEARFMGPNAVPWQYLTHVCFAFGSIGSDYRVNISEQGMSVMTDVFAAASAAGVKPILSIGGWGLGSAGYSAMVSSNTTRHIFIQSLQDYVEEYGVTGVDLDWEWPGRESDPVVPYNNVTDIPNFLLLLQDLRNAFGNNITLSAAVASTSPLTSDMSPFAKYMDWVGLMMYDFAAGNLNETTADAPLWSAGDDEGYPDSIEAGVDIWVQSGMPKSKMVLGIPSYGRSFTLKNYMSPFEDGLYNPCYTERPAGDSDQSAGTGVWKWRNLLSQGVLVEDTSLGEGMYIGNSSAGWNYRYDNQTLSPYVWSNVTAEFIQYDDPVTISYKREYAKNEGMQGMMVWEIAYDDDQGTLLSYMN